MKHASHPSLEIPNSGRRTEGHPPPTAPMNGGNDHSDTDAAMADLITRANAACERGDRAAAMRCLAAARQRPPATADEALTLGYLTLNLEESDVALQYFTIAACLAPRQSFTHASRALALQLLDRSEEASQAARRALQLNPKDGVALKVLARISLNAQRPSDARLCCLKILSQNPDDPDAKLMLRECGAAKGPARTDPSGIPAPKPAALTPECALFGAPAASSPPTPSSVETGEGLSDEQIRQLLHTLLRKPGFRVLQKLGFHLQRNDYYSPLNDCDYLEANRDLWTQDETPADIDWRPEDQLEVAREVSRFIPELRHIPAQPPADCSSYGWKNNFWESADALVQYGIVRARRPARYVEIGCGWSSLLLKQALERNVAEGRPAEVTLVEPYPNQAIFRHLPAEWQVHKSILQRAPFALFDQLQAGDVLFYDGSHCAKVGSDVNWFFFKILPRLKPGVIIHLHDIFLPKEYPPHWIFERGQTWNEQYVLRAFLMNNAAYQILVANHFLFLRQPKELERLYQSIQPVYGCSFWMQKIEP